MMKTIQLSRPQIHSLLRAKCKVMKAPFTSGHTQPTGPEWLGGFVEWVRKIDGGRPGAQHAEHPDPTLGPFQLIIGRHLMRVERTPGHWVTEAEVRVDRSAQHYWVEDWNVYDPQKFLTLSSPTELKHIEGPTPMDAPRPERDRATRASNRATMAFQYRQPPTPEMVKLIPRDRLSGSQHLVRNIPDSDTVTGALFREDWEGTDEVPKRVTDHWVFTDAYVAPKVNGKPVRIGSGASTCLRTFFEAFIPSNDYDPLISYVLVTYAFD